MSSSALMLVVETFEKTFLKNIKRNERRLLMFVHSGPTPYLPSPELSQDLKSQFAIVREATEALNIPYIAQRGVEADDLIATYTAAASAAGHRITILTPDKDMLQLVAMDNVTVVDPSPGKNERAMDRAAVKMRWGVEPEQIPELQAIIGDKVDNSTQRDFPARAAYF